VAGGGEGGGCPLAVGPPQPDQLGIRQVEPVHRHVRHPPPGRQPRGRGRARLQRVLGRCVLARPRAARDPEDGPITAGGQRASPPDQVVQGHHPTTTHSALARLLNHPPPPPPPPPLSTPSPPRQAPTPSLLPSQTLTRGCSSVRQSASLARRKPGVQIPSPPPHNSPRQIGRAHV